MSGVLHPVGPEPERTYWLRRATLIVILVLLVAALIGVAGLFGGGRSATAEPPAGTSETPTSAPTSAPTSSAADPSASSTPTASGTSTPSSSATAAPPLDPSASSSPTSSSSTKARSVLPTAAPKPIACAPSALRATLIGPRRLKVDQDATFSVSLINGSSATCTVAVTPAAFELKIYSGTDRIWSTNDCAKAVKAVSVTLAPEKALSWKQAWNGRRSAQMCASKASLPRAGVYWATAQLDGAKPVQLRMILR